MERSYELEIMRRSIAMLTPGATALSREDALSLLEELADVDSRLKRLKAELRELAEKS